MSKRIALMASVIALGIVLTGCGGPAASSPPATPAPATQPAAEGAPASGKVAPVELGTPVTVSTWTLTAKSADRSPAAGGGKADPGKELVVIAFDLKNGAAKDQGIGPTSFKFAGTDGTEFQATPTSDPTFIFNTPQPIKAGETRTIKIAYAVPVAAGPFQWRFEPFVEGGSPEPGVVNIK